MAHEVQTAVVIPLYNRAKTVLATLDCVVAQTLAPVRVVVVDDGSTDASADSVRRWAAKAGASRQVSVIRQPHRSAAAARNVGWKEVSHADYVSFLDSDDHWPVDFLQRAVRQLQRQPEAVAASVDRRFVNAEGTTWRRDDCRALAQDPLTWIFRHGAGIASSTLIRTLALRRVGLWNENLSDSEDVDLFCRLAVDGPWVHASGEPVTFWHDNAAARSEAGNLSKRHQDSLLRWAGAYESVFAQHAERLDAVQLSKLRAALGALWYRAARQQQRLGDRQMSRRCMRRARYWNRWLLRAWLPRPQLFRRARRSNSLSASCLRPAR